MALDPLQFITEGCWLALRFGLHISAVPTGNLRVVDGVYALGAGKTYHPLEAALVDVAASGDWRKDVATALGVDAMGERVFGRVCPGAGVLGGRGIRPGLSYRPAVANCPLPEGLARPTMIQPLEMAVLKGDGTIGKYASKHRTASRSASSADVKSSRCKSARPCGYSSPGNDFPANTRRVIYS